MVNILIQHGADLTALFHANLNEKQLTDLLKQHAAKAYRGMEAVILLNGESRVGVLNDLYPKLKSKQIHEDLAMFEALGLKPKHMAQMWKSSHDRTPDVDEAGLTL